MESKRNLLGVTDYQENPPKTEVNKLHWTMQAALSVSIANDKSN